MAEGKEANNENVMLVTTLLLKHISIPAKTLVVINRCSVVDFPKNLD
jgi:hypothetical protein